MNENNIREWVLTGIILLSAFAFRYITTRILERSKIKSIDLKRRWMYHTKSWTIGVAILIVTILWASELRSFMLGIITFLVAIIIATKELILCITGGVYRALSSPFSIGDRIRVNDFHGEVIDQSIIMTRILELGPDNLQQFTGTSITIPNSTFLTHSVVNESFTSHYVMHQFRLPPKEGIEPAVSREKLLTVANEIYSRYQVEAEKSIKKFLKSHSILGVELKPRVIYVFSSSGEAELLIRMPVPDQERIDIQQKIISSYLEN